MAGKYILELIWATRSTAYLNLRNERGAKSLREGGMSWQKRDKWIRALNIYFI
ncbi:hypothetical protein PM082_013500 [Marasmius tenuissimus]|nr:hypothetical protein PM082_013500 [Marasmius tenuissimus]